MPLHHVKELLGHASISTTDTYLNAGRMHLQDSMRRLDAGIFCTKFAHNAEIEHPPVSHKAEDSDHKSLIN